MVETLLFGAVGFLELLLILNLVHHIINQRNKTKGRSGKLLAYGVSLLFGFGYALSIFIIEGGATSFEWSSLLPGMLLYLSIYSFFCVLMVVPIFIVLDLLLTSVLSKKRPKL